MVTPAPGRRGATGLPRPGATPPTSPGRSVSTARSSWPATRSPSRRCPPSSRRSRPRPARPTATPTTAPSPSPRRWPSATASTPTRWPPAAARSRSARSWRRPTTTPARASPSPGGRSRCTRSWPAWPGRAPSRCRSPAVPAAGRHPRPAAARRGDRRHHPPGLRLQPEQPHRDGGPPRGAGGLPRCGAREPLVVLDEAYREFVTDPDVPDGIELMRGRPNVAVLRTFSKAWGLAGCGSAT